VKAKLTRSIHEDMLHIAAKLRKKADQLEKKGDRPKAVAARDLAQYLENQAADI